MSKNHSTQQSAADLDAELDQYLKNKKVTPAVSRANDGINLFGSEPEKKKPLLHRIIERLRTFRFLNLQ